VLLDRHVDEVEEVVENSLRGGIRVLGAVAGGGDDERVGERDN
jgi:hypothetical protein